MEDEIAAIRARHEERMHFSTQPPPQIAADFATLLRAVDRLSAAVNALPELVALRKENERLREALAPFAAVALNHPEMDSASTVITLTYNKTHIRRARAALNQEPGHE